MSGAWGQELDHFAACRAIIQDNIKQYELEYEQRHRESTELFRAIQGGDVELYNQLMTTQSMEEHSENQLRKNRAAYARPYFGRIDFTDCGKAADESLYIGKNGVFQNKTEVVVADWRAPVSGVYYENELGKGSYPLPAVKGTEPERVEIDLHLKRTYDVADGSLIGYYDSDVAANDELLIKYLSRNKDAVLGEIIATIQKEQNEIIRESPFAHQIVQGVAGSGKTTVAMHRISYILYNYKERFLSNEFCVVGSNDLLLSYITGGLPELDVTNIKKMRMDSLFIHLLKKAWKSSFRMTKAYPDAGRRCHVAFFQKLDVFLQKKRESFIPLDRLSDKTIGVLLTESSNRSLLAEQGAYSVLRLLLQMDDRVRSRIKSLKGLYDRSVLAQKQKEYSNYYRNRFPRMAPVDLYAEFLEHAFGEDKRVSNDQGMENGAGGGNREHMTGVRKGQFDLYDIAALVLIYYRIFQKEPDEEFGQIFIDEAQDFGSGLYYVLKKVLPACYFTIMGDVSQNINYETGMNDWEDLKRSFLTGTKDRFQLLSKSYRNTVEISQYAGIILEKASGARYQITPVIRHGLPVVEEQFWSRDEMAARILALIPEIRAKGYESIAIICRSADETKKVREQFFGQPGDLTAKERSVQAEENARETGFNKGIMILPVSLTKGMEFDTVILWNPVPLHDNITPAEAKLLYVAVTRALHELYVFRW